MSIEPTSLTRRDAFKWMGAAGAAALVAGRTTLAQTAPSTAPAAEVHGGGFYRTQVGAFEVTILSDGSFPFGPIQQIFGLNADTAAVEAALAAAFIEPDQAFGQVNSVLIRGAGATVLVDAGVGKLFGPSTGFMPQNLARAGVRPEEVTHLVLTHLHPDHIGGALTPDGRPAYRNAKVIVHQAEQAFWTGEKPDFSRSSTPQAIQEMSIAQARKVLGAVDGQLTLIDGPRNELIPGLSLVHAPGHTPGHVTLDLQSQDQRLVHVADLAHHFAITFPHPYWHVAFDVDRDAAVERRKQVFAQLANDRVLVTGAHLPFPALGHLRKQGEDSYAYVPVPWKW